MGVHARVEARTTKMPISGEETAAEAAFHVMARGLNSGAGPSDEKAAAPAIPLGRQTRGWPDRASFTTERSFGSGSARPRVDAHASGSDGDAGNAL